MKQLPKQPLVALLLFPGLCVLGPRGRSRAKATPAGGGRGVPGRGRFGSTHPAEPGPDEFAAGGEDATPERFLEQVVLSRLASIRTCAFVSEIR